MKIAYLVFAYKNPQLLKREIGKLSSEECAFFIHIDQKSNMKDFSRIRGENVFFSEKRMPVYWAEFSGVQAMLLLLRQALEGPQDYDYFVLLSGSEYPLRSRKYIHTFLEENRGLEFINIVKMPAPGKPISRINTLRIESDKPVRRFAVRALAKVGLAQRDFRKYLGSLEPYSGITWWALTRDACQYILEFVARNQHVAEYFQNVFAPEETFFHTILGNSAFRSRIRRNLLYEDWSVQGGHPAMINGTHVAFFEAQEKVCVSDVYGPGELLFARKFSDDSLDLLQRIDDMIERKEERRTSLQS
jgi:Core-2/I-Branching enzyme